MTKMKPDFMDSPFFVDEPGNWHLKPGAPKEMQEEFEKYMAALEDENVPGTIFGNHISYPYDE
ncbi:hypothetical protein B5V88_00230 [Heyndrickxia sporothermodurans]|uniref:Uncharacterized protein n=1 Tax=Heyndrickxia sporothermodurans TaxID=46224 RepID=A0AB37H7M3_9BACI|nr:hypothetical protein [Heyndrickxia sporothermodurans]MBL5771910.1 hypothetical protein [Heyndrickxia sporothermodurans]MBL5775079.1 hypothetical protein [Heyndrickxia sporothermodurans]MBL5778752.1 hypothetical protein [Heyndrickxia sporothermodurans]MBL5782029.1 hypothetical protein [Heyndrickxia sporothermodurans]MBL5792390.1 hypothetical protein [Heyndrickxia sporothermodurans]